MRQISGAPYDADNSFDGSASKGFNDGISGVVWLSRRVSSCGKLMDLGGRRQRRGWTTCVAASRMNLKCKSIFCR